MALQDFWSPGLRVFSERPFVCFRDKKSWNLGLSNAKLSYYDGMIQLHYKGGTPYNDEKHTPRATLITFLCDREVGVGVPEYQVGVCRVHTHVCLCADGSRGENVALERLRRGLRLFWSEMRFSP